MRASIAIALAVALATALFPLGAQADTKAGNDAWNRGDYAAAVAAWIPEAENEDPNAQFNLGQAYAHGKGVPQDLRKAEDMFSRAAANGHPLAADNLGLILFQRGERVRALPLIRAAVDHGEPRAQYLLGLAFFNGDAVPRDWVRAYALVSLAKAQGLIPAAQALEQMDAHVPADQREEGKRLAALATPGNMALLTSVTPIPAAPSLAPAPAPARMSSAPSRVPAQPSATARAAAPPPPALATTPPLHTAAPGSWYLQLGAFADANNAEALWNRLRNRPEIAGYNLVRRKSGRLTLVLATGYPSQAAAKAACARLAADKFVCAPAKGTAGDS